MPEQPSTAGMAAPTAHCTSSLWEERLAQRCMGRLETVFASRCFASATSNGTTPALTRSWWAVVPRQRFTPSAGEAAGRACRVSTRASPDCAPAATASSVPLEAEREDVRFLHVSSSRYASNTGNSSAPL